MTDPITRRQTLKSLAVATAAPVFLGSHAALAAVAEPAPADDLETRAARWAWETYLAISAGAVDEPLRERFVSVMGENNSHQVEHWAGLIRKMERPRLYVPVLDYAAGRHAFGGGFPFGQIEFERVVSLIYGRMVIVTVPCGDHATWGSFKEDAREDRHYVSFQYNGSLDSLAEDSRPIS